MTKDEIERWKEYYRRQYEQMRPIPSYEEVLKAEKELEEKT